MTGLRFLYLQILSNNWIYIPDILNDITLCVIDQVDAEISYPFYRSNDIWRGMPPIVARPNFRRLRKLEFCMVISTGDREAA
jgi:hypothetical protein